MNKRISWVDMAKGYGIILVIIGHFEIENVGGWIYSFHLPLFFFLSGYVYKKSNEFVPFIKKKTKAMLVPYCFLATIIIIVQISYKLIKGFSLSILKDIVPFILEIRCSTLWFLTCLFVVEILMFFIVKVKKIHLQFGIVVIMTLVGLLYAKFIHSPLIWNIDVSLTAIAFFYVGYILKQREIIDRIFDTPSRCKWIFIFLCLNVVGLVINYCITGKELEMYQSEYAIWPITYLTAFCGIFATILISRKYTNKFIMYLGRNSLIYFGLHQAVIMNLMDGIYKRINLFQNEVLQLWEILLRAGITFSVIIVTLTIFNEIIIRSKWKFLLGR